MAQLKTLTINDTGFIKLPSGTTAQRPSVPTTGMMRFNTDLSCNEYYDGTNWIDPVTGGAPVVTSGLVLNLDAGISRSYGGSGTLWRDLTGRGNNGDIKSGVSYSNNSFNFTLNSSNELIDVAHSSDLNYSYLNWAYSLWMKINFDDDGTWTQLFIKGNDNGNRRPGIWFYSGQTSRFHFTWNANGQAQQELNTTDPITTPIGVWANWVFQSRNGVLMVHKNGVQDANTLAISERNTNTEPLHIGGYNYRSPGIDLASFMVYNKSLSDTEILNNYNSLKGRFGL